MMSPTDKALLLASNHARVYCDALCEISQAKDADADALRKIASDAFGTITKMDKEFDRRYNR